jgi:hypothetical protein
VIAPWRRTLRRKTLRQSLHRSAEARADELYESANSYFGLLRQATHSHADRARLANLVRHRGHAVDRTLTKALSMTPECTAEELRRITGYTRPAEQLRELRALGVPARRRPDGSVLVLRGHLERPPAPVAPVTETARQSPRLRAVR